MNGNMEESIFYYKLLPNKSAYSISLNTTLDIPNNIEIPKEYNGLPVTHIESKGFANCENLISVFIPNTIKSINSYGAFKGCSNLSLVLFEKNSDLKYIGYATFKDCSQLESIIIPESVINMEENIFEGCSNLTELYITTKKYFPPIGQWFTCCVNPNLNIYLSEENINEWREYVYCLKLNINILPLPKYIPTDLGYFKFKLNDDKKSYIICLKDKEKMMKNLVLPWSYKNLPVTIIDEKGFYFQIQLESLKLPKYLKVIGKSAFWGCIVKELELPDSLEIIESRAFGHMLTYFAPPSIARPGSRSKLEKVIISNNSKLSFIGTSAFYANIKLKEFSFPKTLTHIGSYAFSASALESIYIGEKVEHIGYNAFMMASEIKNIVVDPANPIYYKVDDALYNNSVLDVYPPATDSEIYTMPDFVRVIYGRSTFYQSKNLRVIYINSKIVPRFLYDTPEMSTNLQSTKIYVPDEVVNEYKKAIQWEYYADNIYPQSIIKDGIAKIDNTLIQWIDSKEDITIPKDIEKIGPYALGQDKTIKNIYVDSQNTSLKSEDGVLFNFDKSDLIRYGQAKEAKEYKVPNSVKKLGIGAFIGGENLKTIVLGENVEEISEYAFGSCFNLKKINLENIKKIGSFAFYYCNLSGKINLNAIEILEDNIFRREKIYITDDDRWISYYHMNISEIVLGEKIQYIGKNGLPSDIILYIYALTPPTVHHDNRGFKKIYVPRESLDLYKNSPFWKEHALIILPMD